MNDSAVIYLLISAAMLAIPVYYFIDRSRIDKKKKYGVPEQPEEPNEEMLYDSYTGRHISVEEAKRGIIIDEKYLNRIKTDDEIFEYHGGSSEEFAKNELRKQGIKGTDFPGDINAILRESGTVSFIHDWFYDDLFLMAPGCYLFFVHIDFYNQNSHIRNLLLIKETDTNLGHYIMLRESEFIKWVEKAVGSEHIMAIENYIIERRQPIYNEQDLIELFKQIGPSEDIIIETYGKYFIAITDNGTGTKELDDIMRVFNTIQKSTLLQLKN